MFNWLNIELTNRCNKSCWFCGRAKARSKNEVVLGDIDIVLFRHIIGQFEGDIIQFSKDGEPLLYQDLETVASACVHLISNVVTNGILLWEKAEIVKQFSSVCVSVIEDDQEQFITVKKFVEYHDTPVTIKFLGDYDNDEYRKLGLRTTSRAIHHSEGDWGYNGNKPVVPELGICLDFLNKPSIDWQGDFYICNRYDPDKKGRLGNCKTNSLQDMWDSRLRQEWLKYHMCDEREKIPLCRHCNFWGIATNGKEKEKKEETNRAFIYRRTQAENERNKTQMVGR